MTGKTHPFCRLKWGPQSGCSKCQERVRWGRPGSGGRRGPSGGGSHSSITGARVTCPRADRGPAGAAREGPEPPGKGGGKMAKDVTSLRSALREDTVKPRDTAAGQGWPRDPGAGHVTQGLTT